MNRQYIGARYVPKFSDKNGGIWDNSYSYEALEMVQHGNDTYTSKKPVPTGIEITNTDYWVLTGNYNGSISTLTSKVALLEKEVIPVYTPKLLDMEGEEVADIINAVPEGGYLIFEKDTYLIGKQINIEKKINIDFNGSTLSMTTDMVSVPKLNQGQRKYGMYILAECTISNAIIDCNNDSYSNFYTSKSVDDRIYIDISPVVIGHSDVKLDHIKIQNCARNCINVYRGGIHNIDIGFSSFINSCCGIGAETPGDTSARIDGLYVHNCYIEAISSYSGVASSLFESCIFVRPLVMKNYAGGYAVFRAGLNDAPVVHGSNITCISCVFNDLAYTGSGRTVRIDSVNPVSQRTETALAKFIGCTFLSDSNNGIDMLGNASFDNCIFGTYLQINSVNSAVGCAIENCMFDLNNADRGSIYMGSTDVANKVHITMINNRCRFLSGATGSVTLPNINNQTKGNNVTLIAISNRFNGVADLSYMQKGVLLSNINLSDSSDLSGSTITKSKASNDYITTNKFNIPYAD